MELVAKHILRELDLPLSNLLYANGGNFFILAPASKEKLLEEIRGNISQLMLKAHGGDLYVALGWTPVKLYEFLGKGMAEVWTRASKEAAKFKIKRFSELGLAQKFDQIFGPISLGRENEKVGICSCCHLEKEFAPNVEEGEKICLLCHSFTEIPKKLKQADFYVEEDIIPEYANDSFNSYQDVFRALGFKVEFTTMAKDSARTYRLNNTEMVGRTVGFKFAPIGVPTKNGKSKDFDELARETEGIKKLGYLKLDVDNLGVMFKEGLSPQKRTLSRIVSLSRMFELFFAGYINRIADGYSEKVSIVFSGGDDTFVIGGWNSVYEFMSQLRTEFNRFVAQNPYVTISAGFAMFDPKFPIFRASSIVEKVLELAKDRKNGKPLDNYPDWREKNRVTIMGEPLKWEDEFPAMEEIRKEICNSLEADEALAMARRIMRATKGFEGILQDSLNGMVSLQKVWRFAYFLRREKRVNPELVDKLVDRNEQIIVNNLMKAEKVESPYILPLAARLTDFRFRKD
jgi:CRISPR-associated protein Csm1